MCNTANMPMHAEQPPSKECRVPMEVVVEASPVSIQDMEIEEDLKKHGWMIPLMMGTVDIKKKESPEQKRIQNEEKPIETTMVCVLFIEMEEMIYEEEEQDNQAAYKEKVKMIDTKMNTRNKKPPK